MTVRTKETLRSSVLPKKQEVIQWTAQMRYEVTGQISTKSFTNIFRLQTGRERATMASRAPRAVQTEATADAEDHVGRQAARFERIIRS